MFADPNENVLHSPLRLKVPALSCEFVDTFVHSNGRFP